ncbi:unnamed protein product, partial [Candidula unifasciata]
PSSALQQLVAFRYNQTSSTALSSLLVAPNTQITMNNTAGSLHEGFPSSSTDGAVIEPIVTTLPLPSLNSTSGATANQNLEQRSPVGTPPNSSSPTAPSMNLTIAVST